MEFMNVIKMLHVLCVFVWIGNLLSLTRLMGYHVKEDERMQMQMAKIYRRMYNFVEMPTMVLSILLGVVLLTRLDQNQNLLWFYLKLTFVAGLVGCDLTCGHFVRELNQRPDTGRGVKYKILHGITGLMLIGALVSIYVLHDKKSETREINQLSGLDFQEKQLAKIDRSLYDIALLKDI